MKNLFRLLICSWVLATPQLLSAECTHAYGDCNNPNISAWDVETCWYGNGTGLQTIYWCTGEVEYRPIYAGAGGGGDLHIPTVSFQ